MLDHHFCHLPTPDLGPGHRRGFGPDAGVVILHVAGRFILAQWHLSRLWLAGMSAEVLQEWFRETGTTLRREAGSEAPMVTREFLLKQVGNVGFEFTYSQSVHPEKFTLLRPGLS